MVNVQKDIWLSEYTVYCEVYTADIEVTYIICLYRNGVMRCSE